MTASKRAADTLIIVVLVLLAWQALHQMVGATALPGPVPTLAYLAEFVPSERFAENAWATLVCFFYALLLSYGIGLAIGVWMGVHRLSAAVGEPILISLYTLPKVPLYPVLPALVVLTTFAPGISCFSSSAVSCTPPFALTSARGTTWPTATAQTPNEIATTSARSIPFLIGCIALT